MQVCRNDAWWLLAWITSIIRAKSAWERGSCQFWVLSGIVALRLYTTIGMLVGLIGWCARWIAKCNVLFLYLERCQGCGCLVWRHHKRIDLWATFGIYSMHVLNLQLYQKQHLQVPCNRNHMQFAVNLVTQVSQVAIAVVYAVTQLSQMKRCHCSFVCSPHGHSTYTNNKILLCSNMCSTR